MLLEGVGAAAVPLLCALGSLRGGCGCRVLLRCALGRCAAAAVCVCLPQLVDGVSLKVPCVENGS